MRILDLACGTPWLITEPALRHMLAIAMRQDLDQTLAEAMRAEREARPSAVATRQGDPLDGTRTITMRDGVAIVRVTGPIFRYANLFTRVSGATSTETLALDIQRAIDDPRVNAILLSIDSPGGEATGISELADVIFAARDKKPIWAYAEGLIASAAYWIGSAASKLVIDATAAAGSIGVVVAVSNPAAKTAEEIEIVSTNAPNKRPDVTTEVGRAEYQRLVDAIETVFIDTVARNRAVTRSRVLKDFGQGGLRVGADAVKARMADAVDSFEATLDELVTAGLAHRQSLRRVTSARAVVAPAVAPDEDDDGDLLAASDVRRVVAQEDPEVKLSEMWRGAFAGFMGAAKEHGIPIEPDEPATAAATPTPVAPPASPAPQATDASSARLAALEAQLAEEKAARQKAEASAAEHAAAVAKAASDARTQRLTALASSFHGETAAHLTVLTALADAGGEESPAFTAYVTTQKAAAEAIASGKLFAELGSDKPAAGGDATERFMSLVAAKRKETPSLSVSDAMAAVAREEPELYAAHAAASSIKVG